MHNDLSRAEAVEREIALFRSRFEAKLKEIKEGKCNDLDSASKKLEMLGRRTVLDQGLG